MSEWSPKIAATKEEAIARNVPTYAMNGVPCDNNHVSARRTSDDRCLACLADRRTRVNKPIESDIEVRKKLDRLADDRALEKELRDFWEE